MKKHQRALLATAALLALTFAFTAPAAAFDLQKVDSPQKSAVNSKVQGLTIKSTTINGPTVQIVVKSDTIKSKFASVSVLAVVNGKQVKGVAPVSIAPNGSAQVTIGFMGPVDGVINGMIQENPNPI